MAKTSLLRPNSYANAEGWDDLVQAFTESLEHSSLDEMVLLLHVDIPGPYEHQSEYARQVDYNALEEVPHLLLSVAPSALRTSATSTHQERQRVEEATRVQPHDDQDGQAEEEHNEMPREKTSNGTEAVTLDEEYKREVEESWVNAAKAAQARVP